MTFTDGFNFALGAMGAIGLIMLGVSVLSLAAGLFLVWFVRGPK